MFGWLRSWEANGHTKLKPYVVLKESSVHVYVKNPCPLASRGLIKRRLRSWEEKWKHEAETIGSIHSTGICWLVEGFRVGKQVLLVSRGV